jgi:hypothetical protein
MILILFLILFCVINDSSNTHTSHTSDINGCSWPLQQVKRDILISYIMYSGRLVSSTIKLSKLARYLLSIPQLFGCVLSPLNVIIFLLKHPIGNSCNQVHTLQMDPKMQVWYSSKGTKVRLYFRFFHTVLNSVSFFIYIPSCEDTSEWNKQTDQPQHTVC